MTADAVSFGQYVSEVGLYSSEYGAGRNGPQVYAASNLVGKPVCYPDYGDHSRVYSLCEYGRWWQCCPSAAPPLPDRRPLRTPSLAFVDVKFTTAVYPEHVDIFESYHCGSVVRVWGRHTGSRWWLLYEGVPTPNCGAEARIFCPPIRRIESLVSLIRLELDYSGHSYHPCLDAVLLTGRLPSALLASTATTESHDASLSTPACSSLPSGREVREASAPDQPPDGREPEPEEDERESRGSAGTEAASTASGTSDGGGEMAQLMALIEEDLSCLNICNKVVMHGLQNCVRTRDDILLQGPDRLGTHTITELVQAFLEGGQRGRYLTPPRASSAIGRMSSAGGSRIAETPIMAECLQGDVTEGGFFKLLPPEVCLRILALLDLRSLCRIAQTCCAMCRLAYHPHLYAHITLKDWWWVIDNTALYSLMSRLSPRRSSPTTSNNRSSNEEDSSSNGGRASGCEESNVAKDEVGTSDSEFEVIEEAAFPVEEEASRLKLRGRLVSLDLSWCGPYGAVVPSTFLELIHTTGHGLRVLRLSCCDFVDNYCLYMVANVCTQLQELDVSRCFELDFLGLGELKKLSQLTRVDVSHTRLQTQTLQVLVQHVCRLRHLAVSGCTGLDLDEACVALAHFCPQLSTLRAWKTRGLTQRGLRALASLVHLTDLDLGWACGGNGGLGNSVVELVERCPGLERLRLTASRYLSDADVSAVARCCPRLQQLDVMGNANLTPDSLNSVLQQCPQLRLLDVSYCPRVTADVVMYWNRRFPHVHVNAGAETQHWERL